MALTPAQRRLLRNATPGLNRARLDELVDDALDVPRATRTDAGTVLMAAPVANTAAATPSGAEFNALLAALRTAGVLAP